MIRKSLAFASAAALVISPVVAQASAPLPVQAAAVERAGAEPGDSALAGTGMFAKAVFGIIIILGLLTATGVIFDDNAPESP